jgi:hypothetical protein
MELKGKRIAIAVLFVAAWSLIWLWTATIVIRLSPLWTIGPLVFTFFTVWFVPLLVISLWSE